MKYALHIRSHTHAKQHGIQIPKIERLQGLASPPSRWSRRFRVDLEGNDFPISPLTPLFPGRRIGPRGVPPSSARVLPLGAWAACKPDCRMCPGSVAARSGNRRPAAKRRRLGLDHANQASNDFSLELVDRGLKSSREGIIQFTPGGAITGKPSRRAPLIEAPFVLPELRLPTAPCKPLCDDSTILTTARFNAAWRIRP